ncbi:putative disease resistance protein At4g11170 isoform X2 [Cynara cardunculus var. scolymus]|uniref:putative disease resistance protein At4g11170 isoform X2 n=1 Tax=Cynara cardunculus var. scolymus TaxID=59895 RepID=UPI000D62AEA2|nr:putative disease resistance protein At4g11170 isoform X2 [Cynara cardunculus var. scolymus]
MASSVATASRYDVFLSFRGEDTRNSFTDHLYAALVRAGLRTFRDSNDLDRGEQLKPEIKRAIKESRASVVVLSENYATSTWCLDELWLILEQRRDCNHFVLPVFYHVNPADVRKQDKTFKIEIETSSKWTDQNVSRWTAALMEVADLAGLVLSGLETKLLADIVHTIHNKLDFKLVSLPSNLTGMDTRFNDISSWLKQIGAEFLTICGMGGSGKTTLAKYILDSNWQKFENISFVEDIGSRCKEPHDCLELQEKLLGDILGGKKRKIPSVSHGMYKIEVALQTKKALIVLDDIVEQYQLVALLGTGKINSQSKIIITTRVLSTEEWFESRSWRCQKYQMKLLNDDESLELLSRHAFRSKIPMEGFEELALQAVHYCEGNPLALEVLGSSLFVSAEDLRKSSSILYWERTLNLLEREIDSGIQRVLVRSYNSLPRDSNKELFLHIVCFFIGKDMDYVVKILEHDYSASSGIRTLNNRCLLSVSPTKKLRVHRLLQEMGRTIVHQESPKDPAKRSRVWRNTESYNVLRTGKGSETLEGLALDMQMLKEEKCAFKTSGLMTDSLQKMDNLKLLQLKYVPLTGSYENFSEHLRWICWPGFHLRTIPSDLFMGNLVALDMSYSCLEVFDPPMVLQSLQILNLKDSQSLFEIRNIYKLPNLETLILWNCHSLVHICETIGGLKNLALLDMTGCEHVCKRGHTDLLEGVEASTSGGRVIEQPTFSLPHSLYRVLLKDCYLECSDSFPLSFSSQSFLQYLNLGNNLFEFLPNYNHLKSLRVLDLTLCSRLIWILCLPSTLAELYVYYCVSLEKITFQSHRFTLQEFGYEGCISLYEIEGFIKLVPLVKLNEADLGHMEWLKEHQNHEVCLVGDDELTIVRSCQLQMLYEFNIMSISLPDIKDPNITPEYISEFPSVSFDVPMCPKDKRLKGIDVTFKYTLSGEDWVWFAKISTSNGVDIMYNPKVFGMPALGEVGIWLSYWPIGNTLAVGDKVNVSIAVMNGLEISECGASLVYTDDEIANETLQSEVEWVEILGGDLSGFQLCTGAYYLCRRDFFELMEVGRLTPGWFRILVGDTIDYAEVRGWRKTGRPQESNQSFMELKTISCIIHGPGTEQSYNITEMPKSSCDIKTSEFTSSMHWETMISPTASELGHLATKSGDITTAKASIIDETLESTSRLLEETVKSEGTSESESLDMDMDMSKAYFVDDAMEFASSSAKETMKSATESESSDSPKKDLLDQLPSASSSSSTVASPWEKYSSFDVYLSYDHIFTDESFKVQLSHELLTTGLQISPYFRLMAGGGYLQTTEVRGRIQIILYYPCFMMSNPQMLGSIRKNSHYSGIKNLRYGRKRWIYGRQPLRR